MIIGPYLASGTIARYGPILFYRKILAKILVDLSAFCSIIYINKG